MKSRANRQIIKKKGSTTKSRRSSRSRVFSLRRKVEGELFDLVSRIDPSANTIPLVSSAFSQFYGFHGEPRFLRELQKYGPVFISSAAVATISAEVGFGKLNQLIERRLSARETKDWATADSIRKDLKSSGIELKDSADGTTTWDYVG